jgi:hypothetical protein
MSNLFQYLFSAFWPKWWPVVTIGSLLGVDAFVSAFWPWGKRQLDRIPHDLRFRLEVILLFFSVFYGGYAAWSEERAKCQEEHDKRIFAETANIKPHDRTKITEGLKQYYDEANKQCSNKSKADSTTSIFQTCAIGTPRVRHHHENNQRLSHRRLDHPVSF